MHILIAAADSTTRALISLVLKKGGHQVEEAKNGLEAWNAMQQPEAPALAILDWMLPEINGLEVVRHVRALTTDQPPYLIMLGETCAIYSEILGPPTDQPPYLIMLTSKTAKMDIIEALKAGANDYLSMPFHADEVLARVEVGRNSLEMHGEPANVDEELRRPQTELSGSRARYYDLYNLAPIGDVTSNERGLFLEADVSASTMPGMSPSTSLQQPLLRAIDIVDSGLSPLHLGKPRLKHSRAQSRELRIVKNDVTERKPAEVESARLAMTTTRRFLTVLVLELKYAGKAVQRLNPDEIQTGFNLFWNSFQRFVTDEEGVPLPPQSNEFVAIFGAETPYSDHAVRAGKAAAAISTWLRERAFTFSQTGQEIPHFSIALHCGETVAMRIPSGDTFPWAVIGEGVSFARTLARVGRTDEVLCSGSFLASFLANLPAGQEILEVTDEAEPDLGGLNWDVADFIPLEESLRNHSTLVGADVKTRQDTATVRFTYLYALADNHSGAVTRVAAAVFPAAISGIRRSPMLADEGLPIRRLGKYRLLKTLGHGGMGTVWLGQDIFGNYVAIKTLHEPAPGEASQIARAMGEDITRLLRGDAVSARPLSMPDRATKHDRRRGVSAYAFAGWLALAVIVTQFVNWRSPIEKKGPERNPEITEVDRNDHFAKANH